MTGEENEIGGTHFRVLIVVDSGSGHHHIRGITTRIFSDEWVAAEEIAEMFRIVLMTEDERPAVVSLDPMVSVKVLDAVAPVV